MAAPLIIPVMGAAAKLGSALRFAAPIAAGAAVGTVVGGQVGAMMTSAQRRAVYDSNRRDINLCLDPADQVRLYHMGMISDAQLGRYLANHGIGARAVDLDAGGIRASNYHFWRRWIMAAAPVPSLESLVQRWHRERDPDERTRLRSWTRNKHALARSEWSHLWYDPREPLPLSILYDLWARGLIDADEFARQVQAAGHTDAADVAALLAVYQPPSLGEVWDLRNRERIDDATAREYLRALGWRRPEEVELLLGLRQNIPGISDIIRYAVREGWDDATAAEFGYDLERPPELDYWSARQGYGWSEDVTAPDGTVIAGKPWSVLDWRAHWQLMSPEQGHRAYWRFRPGRMAKWRGEFPELRPFELPTLERLLKVHDYPVPMRQWLAALNRQPLRLVDIRRFVQAGLRDPDFAAPHLDAVAIPAGAPRTRLRNWAVEEFRDRGLADVDARVVADLAIRAEEDRAGRAEERRREKVRERSIALGPAAYKSGVMTRAVAAAQITGNGVDADVAGAMLDIADVEIAMGLAARLVARVRRDFLAGVLARGEAIDRLTAGGLVGARAVQLANEWELELSQRRRELTSAQILDFAERGLLTAAAANQRLINLGWNNVDSLLLIARVSQDVARSAARSAKSETENRRRAAKTLEAAQREDVSRRKQRAARIRQLTPLSDLKRWHKSGRVSTAYVSRRLRAMGYPRAERSLYVSEMIASKTNGKKPKAGPAAESGPAPAPG